MHKHNNFSVFLCVCTISKHKIYYEFTCTDDALKNKSKTTQIADHEDHDKWESYSGILYIRFACSLLLVAENVCMRSKLRTHGTSSEYISFQTKAATTKMIWLNVQILISLNFESNPGQNRQMNPRSMYNLKFKIYSNAYFLPIQWWPEVLHQTTLSIRCTWAGTKNKTFLRT